MFPTATAISSSEALQVVMVSASPSTGKLALWVAKMNCRFGLMALTILIQVLLSGSVETAALETSDENPTVVTRKVLSWLAWIASSARLRSRLEIPATVQSRGRFS